MKHDKPTAGDNLRCSFCSKTRDEVRKFIAGPAVTICDECVATCVDILADDVSESSPTASVEKQRWHAMAAELAGISDSAVCSLCGKSAFSGEMLSIESRGSLCDEWADAIEDALDQGRPSL